MKKTLIIAMLILAVMACTKKTPPAVVVNKPAVHNTIYANCTIIFKTIFKYPTNELIGHYVWLSMDNVLWSSFPNDAMPPFGRRWISHDSIPIAHIDTLKYGEYNAADSIVYFKHNITRSNGNLSNLGLSMIGADVNCGCMYHFTMITLRNNKTLHITDSCGYFQKW